MPSMRSIFADRLSAKSQRDLGWISLFSVALLAVSSSIAWVLHSGVTKATAQGGQQIAATAPDRHNQLSRLDHGETRTSLARIHRLTIEDQKPSIIEGRAPSRANVSVSLAGKVIGGATAAADGSWSLALERGLGVGDHRLSIRTASSNGGDDNIDTARISVPRGLSGPLVINYQGVELAPPRTVTNAEVRVAQAPALSGPPKARFDSAAPRPIVLAQATSTPVPAQLAAPSSGESALDALQNWLRRANETYQKAIVKRLTEPSTLDGLEARAVADDAKEAAGPKTVEIGEPKVAQPKVAEPKIVEDAARKREELRAAQAKRDEDLRQAEATKKAVDDIAAKEAATATPPAAAPAVDEAARKQADDKRIADETIKRQADLKAAEDKRAAEAEKAADDAASKLADTKRASDDAAVRKQAGDKRLADEAAKRQADMKAAEEMRAAEAKKAVDDAASKSADAKKAADDAAARKQADEKRLADEAQKRLTNEAQKRLADEAQKRLTDEAQKRQADLKAAEDKRAIEATARKLADDKRVSDVKKAADDAALRLADAKKATDEAVVRKQADDRRIAGETAKRLADAERAAGDAKRSSDQAQEAEARRQAALKAAEDTRRSAEALAQAADTVAKPANPNVAMAAPKTAPDRANVPEAVPPQASPPVEPQRMSRSSRRARPVAVAAAPAPGAAKVKQGCELAGNRTTPPGYYIVKAGDTLWDIADLHYDDGTRFALLHRANRRINPNKIRPCQRIFVPAAVKRE